MHACMAGSVWLDSCCRCPSVCLVYIVRPQDLVSMARPFLADPEFLTKAKEGRVEEINTCIACNQVDMI